MSQFFEKIMIFINENTFLLIGICVFLILVLIGYLIDNSVKSKRVRKDIKNKDQVPENIKNEIIKEAMNENVMENHFNDESKESIEEIKNEDNNLNFQDVSKTELNLNEEPEKEDLNASLNLDNTDISAPFSLDFNEKLNDDNNSVLNEPLVLDLNEVEKNTTMDLDKKEDNKETSESTLMSENDLLDLNVNKNENQDNLNIDTPINVDLNYIDPDIDIMNKNRENIKYKNDKKLSEILLNVDKERVNNTSKENSTIFKETEPNIEVNTDVEKSKIEIENDDSSDELEKIMKKLSSMNNDDENNYTNIF